MTRRLPKVREWAGRERHRPTSSFSCCRPATPQPRPGDALHPHHRRARLIPRFRVVAIARIPVRCPGARSPSRSWAVTPPASRRSPARRATGASVRGFGFPGRCRKCRRVHAESAVDAITKRENRVFPIAGIRDGCLSNATSLARTSAHRERAAHLRAKGGHIFAGSADAKTTARRQRSSSSPSMNRSRRGGAATQYARVWRADWRAHRQNELIAARQR